MSTNNRTPSLRYPPLPEMKDRRRPIRVCYLIDNLAVGGTEKQVLGLIAGIQRAGGIPHLCLLDGTPASSRALEPADCPVIRLGVRSFRTPTVLSAAARFIRYLRRERIDIVQLHFRDSTYFGAPLARLAGVRTVLRTRRDLGYWMRRVDYFVSRVIGRFVTATVANCDACRASVIADEAAPPESVHVIANGADLRRFAGIKPLTSLTALTRPRRIGIVANLRPVKNLTLFVRAAANVASKHEDVEFLVAGEGPCRAELQDLVDELGIRNRFHLVGQVPEIPAFLAGLDIAVLTSSTEGLSNSLIEYMAAGRAIVATAAGGNGELIRHGETGLLVPNNCESSLTLALERLLDDAGLATRLGNRAREEARARFDWESVVTEHRRLYTSLIANSLGSVSAFAV